MFKKIVIKGILTAFMLGTFCVTVPKKVVDFNKTEIAYAATKKIAICNTEKLRVRTDAGTKFAQVTLDGKEVYLLMNEKAEIKGEKKADNGQKWYKVTFKFKGKKVTGFVLSDFVKVESDKSKTAKKKNDNTENGGTLQAL